MTSTNRQPNTAELLRHIEELEGRLSRRGVRRRTLLRRGLPVVLSLTAAFAFAGNAFASIPDTNGLIHGCFTVPQGTIHALFLRDPAYTSHCPPGQAPLDWYALPAPGASGNVVQSNGTGGYVSAPLAASSIPAGSNNYIQNRTTQQTGANFNIDGNGVVGGTFSAGSHINTNATYKIAGTTALNVLAANGNVLVGNGAGTSLTSGTNNLAAGTDALHLLTSGRDNTALGFEALYNNTIGISNTATGYGALSANISGNSNVANGLEALQHNTVGYENTASGTGALDFNTAGVENTASGYNALVNNDSGSNNTATGYEALGNNTSGQNNTADGSLALVNNNTGGFNIAIGDRALHANTSGSDNIANGGLALGANTVGNQNIAIGNQALQNNIGGLDNTAIGDGSGATSTGSGNTFLGSFADASVAGLNNATAIGTNAVVGESKATVLGGTGAYAVSVGIGTSTPHSTLQVEGNYVQIPVITTAPPAGDCASAADSGRMVVSSATNKLYFCISNTWIAAP